MITLSRKALWGMIAGIGLAILVLMVFSLDRTAWALALFETGRAWQHERALAGSIVIEVAVVAFILARSVNVAKIREYAIIGLVGSLFVQTLANLWAGWVYGWEATRATLPDSGAAFWVSVAAWAGVNALIPGGIFLLSEIEALLVRYLIASYADERTTAPVAEETAPGTAPAVPIEPYHEPAPIAPAPLPAPVVMAEPQPAAPAPHKVGVLRVERTKAEKLQTVVAALTAPPAERPTLAALGEQLGVSESMVRKYRDELEDAGVLVRDGKAYRKNGVSLEVV